MDTNQRGASLTIADCLAKEKETNRCCFMDLKPVCTLPYREPKRDPYATSPAKPPLCDPDCLNKKYLSCLLRQDKLDRITKRERYDMTRGAKY